jgi:ubiquinone/menaquinone biosynthesis C-methylase UbiE
MRSGRRSSHPLQLSRQGPDRAAALAQYEARAASYDFELALFEPIRGMAIERLELEPGETVLDVGCGTGLSLERLQREVGATGHVVGIEQCPAMIARARNRVRAQANENVTLICAPAEESHLERGADAALFHFTHDVLRRPAALDRVLQHLKPGGRLVACGLQWAPPWALPINLFVWGAALRSVSSLRGLERPWSLLAERVGGLEVEELLLGAVFLAHGVRTSVGDAAKGTAIAPRKPDISTARTGKKNAFSD